LAARSSVSASGGASAFWSILPNCPEILSCYLAASFVGAVIVPTVPALTIEELDYIVSDCEPTVIVTVRGKAEQLRQRQTGARGIKRSSPGGGTTPSLLR
jgi:acyl-CoA synthetase (AMP-forming)/AMP-acid ligase II